MLAVGEKVHECLVEHEFHLLEFGIGSLAGVLLVDVAEAVCGKSVGHRGLHSEDFEVAAADAERVEARRAADFNGLEGADALNPELAGLELAFLANNG